VERLLEAKNHDYENAYQVFGLVGIIIRLHDKIHRLHNLTSPSKHIYGYSVLGLRTFKNSDPGRS
jgi:hypothetical protein